jgi:site-specific DNA-methyltransferase (adenine-specific)
MSVNHSDALLFLKKMDSESVDFIYIDPPYYCQKNFGEFDDRWESVQDYIASLKPQFVESKRILKEHGNICVHVDWHASHWVRVALEEVFGEDNFRNEIVWCYSSGGASNKHFSRKHDSLFVYAKNEDKCRFNPMREPYPRDYGDRPGFHPDGRIMNDWWQIGILSTTAKERSGYPTQKPLQLLERLIQAYTNEGDTVLDYYCGSGTTGVAAKGLGRKYILVDKNQTAIDTANERLKTKGFEEILQ